MSANVVRTTRLPSRLVPTATAIAVTVPGAIVLLVVYYAIGGPFGTLNDLANALVAVLSVVLAAQTARLGVPAAAVAAAGGGGALMVVGSWLVITGRTGWVLAGLVGAVGAGALGAWLATFNVTAGRTGLLSRAVARLGAGSGVLSMLGLLAIPDALSGVDAWDDLQWSGILALMSWLGLYLGYPVWCVLLARAAGQRRTG